MAQDVYIHIPKTAGTKLRHVLMASYPSVGCSYGTPPFRRIASLDPGELARFRRHPAVIGHESYAGFRRHLGDKARYIAVLRNPVDRVISYYNHAQSHFPAYRERKVSLLRFLDIGEPETSNLQTRYLSGRGLEEMPNEGDIEDILARIEAGRLIVGIQEHLDESLACIGLRGWTARTARGRINVSSFGFTRASLTRGEIDAIRARNLLDFRLYAACLRRFRAMRTEVVPA